MNIAVLQENLLPHIQNAVRFIATKPQIPILTGIVLRAKNGKLTLQATDMRMGLEVSFPVKIEEEGEVVAPAKILAEFLHTLSPGVVTIKTEGENIHIIQKAMKGKLPSYAIQEFPPFPQPSETWIELPTSVFLETAQGALYAASLDETRPVLASLLVELREGWLTCVCTDGYRLSVVKTKMEKDISAPLRVLLPARSMQEVLAVIGHSNTKTVRFSVSQELSQSFFTIGEYTVLVRLVEGEFPPYEKIIPTSFAFETIIARQEWISALKTAMVFAREGSSVITMEFSGEGCRISSSNASSGENEGVIASSGKPISPTKIAFNGKFLLDVLNHIDSDDVLFKMNDELKPGLLLPEGKESPLSVIMPFKR